MTRPTRRLLRRLGFDPRDLKRRPTDTGKARAPTGPLDRVLRRPAIRRDLRAAAARLDQISAGMAQQRDVLEASA
jgi:hypothetical protein